jgi:hypothetical protein
VLLLRYSTYVCIVPYKTYTVYRPGPKPSTKLKLDAAILRKDKCISPIGTSLLKQLHSICTEYFHSPR